MQRILASRSRTRPRVRCSLCRPLALGLCLHLTPLSQAGIYRLVMYGGSGPLGTVAATDTDRAAVAQAILRGQSQPRQSRQSTATAMTSSSFDLLPANTLAWPSSVSDRNLLAANPSQARENSSRSAMDVAASAAPLLAPAGTASAALHDITHTPESSHPAASVQALATSTCGVALAEHATPAELAPLDPLGATAVRAPDNPPVPVTQASAESANEQRDLQPLPAWQGQPEPRVGSLTGAAAAPATISESANAATQASQSTSAPVLVLPNAALAAEAPLLSEHSQQTGACLPIIPSVREPPTLAVKTEAAAEASTLNVTQITPPLTQIRAPARAAGGVETTDRASGAQVVGTISTPLQPEPSEAQLATLPRTAPTEPAALPDATSTTIPATPTFSPSTPVFASVSACAGPLAATSGTRVFRGCIVWAILGTLEVGPMNVWVAAARMCCSAALIQAALFLLGISVGFSWPMAVIAGWISPAACLLLAWLEEAWREEEAWLEETPRRRRAEMTRQDPMETTVATSSLGTISGGPTHAQRVPGGVQGGSRLAGAVTAANGRGSRSNRDDSQGSSASIGAGDTRRRIPASRSQPSIPAGATVTLLSDSVPPAQQPLRRPALARHTSMLGAFYDDDFDALVSRSRRG